VHLSQEMSPRCLMLSQCCVVRWCIRWCFSSQKNGVEAQMQTNFKTRIEAKM
jgi:hypothetical protein